jgi:GT2 family glycosyltransferase
MNFYRAFWPVFRSQPQRALGALYWYVTGRKVRARNRLRIARAQGPDAYQLWIRNTERAEEAVADAASAMAGWACRPTFSVLVYQGHEALNALLSQLKAQVYQNWEVIVVPRPGAPALAFDRAAPVRLAERPSTDEGAALRIAIAMARGDYLLPLPDGASLPSTALARYAEALQGEPAVDLVFGDHDTLDGQGLRCRPWFKPDWNPELALAQDYLSQAFVVSAKAAREVGDSLIGEAAAYALALATGNRKGAIVSHVAHVQAHFPEDSRRATAEDRATVVRAHLGTSDAKISVAAHDTVRVDWPLPDRLPLVSIIVPTRDRIDLLSACLSSLDARTSYRPFEVIVVDNGSERADSLDYLRKIAERENYRVIRDQRPYNYSQLNNLAVAQARGEYLCLLNNDTEVIEGDWLSAMMRQAVRGHVGAVGARLLYDDGSLQHAGITVGLGEAAGHAHRFQPREAAGYFARSHAAHYVSAVTAACLVVEKSKFLAVDGLDERDFAVAFNDVDLCLKLQQAGWRNVYTPHATLLHHESKSRGKDVSPQHIDRYRSELGALQQRWGTRHYADPLHNAHLDRASETYLIRL